MEFPYSLPIIIDGMTSCNEITKDDPDNICAEKTVLDNPDILISAKSSAVENGVNSILSPTGGIFHSRLKDLGYDDSFSEFITKITELCSDTGGDDILTGSVIIHKQVGRIEYKSPAFEDCYFSYLEKMTLLKDSGAKYVLLKNHKDLFNMRAGVLAAKTAKLPVFVIMEVDDEGKNNEDTDYIAALITLQSLGASAFGIYCTDGIKHETALIKKAFPHAEIPLIAVINTQTDTEKELQRISEKGASIFIDAAENIQKDKIALLKKLPVKFTSDSEKDSFAAAVDREVFFLPEAPVFSEPLYCTYDMSDELIDFDDENINAIYIELTSTDDASYLADNANMSRLPFIIHSNDITTIEAALRYFQGRLIIDKKCDIDEQKLQNLARKYGAILY